VKRLKIEHKVLIPENPNMNREIRIRIFWLFWTGRRK
jgi:hypothetical protein